jgi:hypothetical protein
MELTTCDAEIPPERSDKRQLPIELILQIINYFTPAHRRALISTSLTSAQTLLSLTRVSKTTHGEAMNLLRHHCMYLDSNDRLKGLYSCIELQKSPARNMAFESVPLRDMASLYLAPFRYSSGDLETAKLASQLIFEVAPTLQKLILAPSLSDLPDATRPLATAIAGLRQLQEFVCLNGYPTGKEPNYGFCNGVSDGEKTEMGKLWHWPQLRRLALFGVPLDTLSLWEELAKLGCVEEVILARPENVDAVNIKSEYFGALEKLGVELDRNVRFMIMDVAYDVRDIQTARWAETDQENRVRVEVYEVPTSFYGDESSVEAVASWFKMGALDGRLWDWRGGVVG